MRYSLEETQRREKEREQQRQLRSVHHHFALLPSTCVKCGHEFHFEFGYRKYVDYGIAILYGDVCRHCATSRREAANVFKKHDFC